MIYVAHAPPEEILPVHFVTIPPAISPAPD
jgi:hypothetical protein